MSHFSPLGHRPSAVGGPAYRRAAEGLWDRTDGGGVCWPVQIWPDGSGVLLGQRHGEYTVTPFTPVFLGGGLFCVVQKYGRS